MIQELEEKINALEAKVNQMVREGIVTEVNPEKATVRVRLHDSDSIVTKELPVVFQRTFENKSYDMPDINEQVICIFLPNGFEQGFVLGSLYSIVDKPPVTDPNKKHYRFPDGTWFEYDRKEHLLQADVKGCIDVVATGTATVQAHRIHLNPRTGGNL